VLAAFWQSGIVRLLGSLAIVLLVAVTLSAFRTHLNETTVALALLLVVLFIATKAGSGPALAASIAAMLSFNYLFLPPVGTLTIADPSNWVALSAFLVTATVVGELSSRARRRAQEAEARRREVESLYEQLRDAFDKASRAEAFRQSEQLKSALLDAVTHDLRTPLTAIKMAATALLDLRAGDPPGTPPVVGEGARDFLLVIDEEADRLNRLIEGLVELARIEAGALRLRQHWSSIDDVIQLTRERLSPVTVRHRLEVDVERDLPLARVDAHALGEVLYALVENAAKYAPAGTRIRISARRRSDADSMITLAVDDEGPGVKDELRTAVFEKFFRGPSAEADAKSSGWGMGLAIARGIVEAHGGRIWIETPSWGRGTRVAFVLPLGDDEPSQPVGADDALAVSTPSDAR